MSSFRVVFRQTQTPPRMGIGSTPKTTPLPSHEAKHQMNKMMQRKKKCFALTVHRSKLQKNIQNFQRTSPAVSRTDKTSNWWVFLKRKQKPNGGSPENVDHLQPKPRKPASMKESAIRMNSALALRSSWKGCPQRSLRGRTCLGSGSDPPIVNT